MEKILDSSFDAQCFGQEREKKVFYAGFLACLLVDLLLKFQSIYLVLVIEPVCCKKQQKKVPGQLLVSGIGDL